MVDQSCIFCVHNEEEEPDEGVLRPVCFDCLGSTFRGHWNTSTIQLSCCSIVTGLACIANKADCNIAGCMVYICEPCMWQLVFPGMASGDYLVTNIDGTFPTITTSAELAIEVVELRLKKAGMSTDNVNILHTLKNCGRITIQSVQAVRVI
jgi:hypothetical protein